eukprot:CAMPEP_0202689114 /NCGR_PEP_ID=MMETSP1385-20130828/4455_1 /ASSEMBLY_ACC=CAM_ASM_000861 /TAXON_ID=933848 /ORGANISM="Elphidium margaritaceum" /LENGTH=314 /DNA_ID=CAMNT_0049344207 /DNA_START=87 /DNA_END=1032 /DNA_ORIENTATION=-
MTYFKAKPVVRSGYGQASKYDVNNSRDMCYSRQFRFATKSRAFDEAKYPFDAECKAPSSSPSPSPSPTTVLSHLCLSQQQSFAGNTANPANNGSPKYGNTTGSSSSSRKRKFECHDMKDDDEQSGMVCNEKPTTLTSHNCLQKVTLSDGSVCYTMTASPSSVSVASAYSVSQPPAKKQRCNRGTAAGGNTKTAKTLLLSSAPPAQDKKNKLVYSNTMPLMHNHDQKKKKENAEHKTRKRRHSDDWTSKEKLLISLQDQTSIQDQLFPDTRVPTVNLKEMFDGLKVIRVHKKLRPKIYDEKPKSSDDRYDSLTSV